MSAACEAPSFGAQKHRFALQSPGRTRVRLPVLFDINICNFDQNGSLQNAMTSVMCREVATALISKLRTL